MAKKKVSQVNKELEERFNIYLEKLQELNAEHGFQPVAELRSDVRQGIYPWLTFEQYVTPKKPETNKSSDTDNKGTKSTGS